jgi:hypothetical protein
MEFPKTLAAAKKAKGAEWSLADALLAEVGPRGSEPRLRDCQAYLKEYGIEYAWEYLKRLHSAAKNFPQGVRTPWLTPEAARQSGSPRVVAKAVEIKKAKAAEIGIAYEPPSQRELAATRKTITRHDRKEAGKQLPPARDKSRVTDHPISDLRRTANMLDLANLAGQAEKLGRDFIAGIAGQEISDDEREDFEANIDDVLETWRAARTAVRNPLSKQLGAYLESF